MSDPEEITFKFEEIISIVSSIFEVSDFQKTEYTLEFRIEDLDFSSKFEDKNIFSEDEG